MIREGKRRSSNSPVRVLYGGVFPNPLEPLSAPPSPFVCFELTLKSNQIKCYAPNTTGVVDLTVKCLHSPDDKTRRKMFFLFTYDGVPWVVRLPEWGSLAEKRLKTTALDYSIFEDDMCRTILSVPISFLQQLIVTGSGTFPSPESVVYSIISC